MHPAAQALYDRALAAFAARDYPAAIRDTEAGYAIDPRREFLFAEAQAKRLAGDCRGAVVLYQRFLTTAPAAGAGRRDAHRARALRARAGQPAAAWSC